jgi:hypothetical protein
MGFSFLKRYEAQKAYYDAYKAWDNKNPEQKQAAFAAITDETKRAKPERVTGYISPFNQRGSTLSYVELRVLSQTQTGEGTDVATALGNVLDNYYIDDTETAPTTSIINPRFKAAKLSFTSKTNFVKKASRITTKQYLKPDVNTVSAPFGQASGGQTYAAATAAMLTAINTWINGATGTDKRSFKFTPEGATK